MNLLPGVPANEKGYSFVSSSAQFSLLSFSALCIHGTWIYYTMVILQCLLYKQSAGIISSVSTAIWRDPAFIRNALTHTDTCSDKKGSCRVRWYSNSGCVGEMQKTGSFSFLPQDGVTVRSANDPWISFKLPLRNKNYWNYFFFFFV